MRPWPAEDGLLVRLRLIGGHLRSRQLEELVGVARRYGDGYVHVTSRANLQVRGLPGADGHLDPTALTALEATGLLPTRTHELVRNVMASPQTGCTGGRADLRPVAGELDDLLCSEPRVAGLPGRFLFVLDDGRGDLFDRPCDLGLVALDAATAQLRVGPAWGPVVGLRDAARALVALAVRFIDVRGELSSAPWHVAELDRPLTDEQQPDPRLPPPAAPLPFGDVPGGRHVAVPPSGLDHAAVTELTSGTDHLVVTPWRGVLVPENDR